MDGESGTFSVPILTDFPEEWKPKKWKKGLSVSEANNQGGDIYDKMKSDDRKAQKEAKNEANKQANRESARKRVSL
jgi:hypothetical protein